MSSTMAFMAETALVMVIEIHVRNFRGCLDENIFFGGLSSAIVVEGLRAGVVHGSAHLGGLSGLKDIFKITLDKKLSVGVMGY